MNSQLEVFNPGAEVMIGGLIGAVSVVQISSGIMYKVTWWNGSEKKSEWFEDFEVSQTEKSVKTTIGFKG